MEWCFERREKEAFAVAFYVLIRMGKRDVVGREWNGGWGMRMQDEDG